MVPRARVSPCIIKATNRPKPMMSRNDKTIHEEAKRDKEDTGRVLIYGPFDSDIIPDTKSRKLYRRKGTWMVRCRGFWCELTGVKVQTEDPRIVVFDTEARDSYR